MYLCLDKFIFIIIEIILWNELDELNFMSWTNSSRLTSCKRTNELARFLTRRSRIHPSSSGPFVETNWLVSLTRRDELEIKSARLVSTPIHSSYNHTMYASTIFLCLDVTLRPHVAVMNRPLMERPGTDDWWLSDPDNWQFFC
jgi:hypothetical protein